MGSGDTSVGFRATESDLERIERFERVHGHEKRSDALQEMVRIADRETRRPLLYRWKNHVIEWAGQISLFALIVVISGFMSTVLTPVHSLMVAAVMLGVAVALVSAVELARVVSGQSALFDKGTKS